MGSTWIPHGKVTKNIYIVLKWNYGGNSMLIPQRTYVEFRWNSCVKVPRKDLTIVISMNMNIYINYSQHL